MIEWINSIVPVSELKAFLYIVLSVFSLTWLSKPFVRKLINDKYQDYSIRITTFLFSLFSSFMIWDGGMHWIIPGIVGCILSVAAYHALIAFAQSKMCDDYPVIESLLKLKI